MNKLNYKGKTYDLDNMGDLVANLTAIQEIYSNLVARYLFVAKANGANVKASLKELYKLLRLDINEMYKNIDENYTFIAPDSK